jgi:ATP-dependent RNA helicase DHX37/DHR1
VAVVGQTEGFTGGWLLGEKRDVGAQVTITPMQGVADAATATKELGGNTDEAKVARPAEGGTATHQGGHKGTTWVQVRRRRKVQEARMELPVCAEEQRIMEQIKEHDIVVIVGETGSGKTTQLPQFLFEAGYGRSSTRGQACLVGCTQPRRVAAYSMAKRVAHELNVGFGDVVSYQVRHESNVTPNTAIKFMTDGVLLREIETDLLLPRYSAIILDEAHERTLNTDLLLGLLPRVVRLRADPEIAASLGTNGVPLPPLKLIIMSATVAATTLVGNKKLFPDGPPPIVKVEARQHPVTVHFSKTTELG